MKKILFLLWLVATCVHAQDVIVKKDGSIIQSTVMEVNETNIKYKKFSNQNGPTYTIGIKEVLAINYKNGEKDLFDGTVPSTSESNDTERAGEIHLVQPDSHNAELIARYNKQPVRPKMKKSGSLAKYGYVFLGVDEQSVLSSEDIEINFVQEVYFLYGKYHNDRFIVQINNKSDMPIYIDKGNCFRVFSDGQAYVYYDASKTTTVGNGSNSGGGVNLGAVAGAFGIGGMLGTLAGGVNVGGGTSSTTSTIYTPQRVIAIPPHGKVALEEFKYVAKAGTLSDSETLEQRFPKENRPQVHKGEILQYDMASSPHTAQYTITYSRHENFSDVKVVKAGIYIKELWGNNEYISSESSEKKLRESMKKKFPEKDDYTIVENWWLVTY